MKSLKKIVTIVISSLILLICSSVILNNFHIKPILELWNKIDTNSVEINEKYIESDFDIRVMKNILGQLNEFDIIEIERYNNILKSYDKTYKTLSSSLKEIYDINNLNIEILNKLDRYFFSKKIFNRRNLKTNLETIDFNIIQINGQIKEIQSLEIQEQQQILDSIDESYKRLKPIIDDFNIKLRETKKDITHILINLFNITLVILFIFIIGISYFVDRIVRKDINYIIYSLKMLSDNNYNMSMLPKIKSRFKEEEMIQQDVEEIFKQRQFINKVKEILSGEYILDETIDKLLYLVKDTMNTNRIGVAYIDYKKGRIVAEHGAFDYGKVLLGPGFSVPIENSSLKNIIETKKGIITNSIPEELKKRPHSPSLKLLSQEGIKSNLIIALILNDTVFGYLFFSSIKENNYSKKDLELGIKIAQEISGILNTTYLTKKMFISMTNAFANLVEKKDNDTGDHILRMTNYSRIIAEALINHENPQYKVSQGFVNDITNYAPVHDIGKVGIPDSILKKTGKLTYEERQIMQTHADIGGDILKEVQDNLKIFDRDFFKIAMQIAIGHHEKWDGSGYPKGLVGNDIPLAARIIAIADVFDALSSRRVYKDDFGFEDSVKIINDSVGSHFDPELVNIFNEVLPEIRKIYDKNKVSQ